MTWQLEWSVTEDTGHSLALVCKKCPAVGRWTCSTIGHPIQMDATSCGVFVCKYPVDREGVAKLRLDMAVTLLTNSVIQDSNRLSAPPANWFTRDA
ncbi:uncharacterized protein LOC142957324 [Anarhichas minor]|uniref:uncharacterized protein LOC142957324 n=1 Tax=Anarhichas minor TaxID=65739 RepID=UPI003F73931D